MKKPEEVTRWWKASRNTRLTKYSPRSLRKAVSGHDKKLQSVMTSDYVGHCEVGTHPTPEALVLERRSGAKQHQHYPSTNLVSTWTAIIEVAFHAREIATIVGFLGMLIPQHRSVFKKLVDELANRDARIEGDKRAASLILGIRLGRENIEKLRSWEVSTRAHSSKLAPASAQSIKRTTTTRSRNR